MIAVKDELTSLEVLDKCKAYLETANWTYGWPSNREMPFGHWNVDLTNSAAENTVDITGKLPKECFKNLWDDVNEVMFGGKATLVRCYANRHTFGTEGYIHTDTEREGDVTCVVYMNNNWNVNWGGETVLYNADKTDIVKSVIPKYGRGLAFAGNIPHCAKPLSRVCPAVRTTLMFKVLVDLPKIDGNDEKLRDFLLEIRANELPHKNGSLMDHLLRTYFILKGIGAKEVLAFAGGLHSVYGTNAYKGHALELDNTRVLEHFGEEVDGLVRTFHEINRPEVLENPDGSLSDIELFLLRCIECANLHDQQELSAEVYPNLYEFAMQMRKR